MLGAVVAATLALAVILASVEAHGHTRSVSYSTWTWSEGADTARVVVRMRTVDATTLRGPELLSAQVTAVGCLPEGAPAELAAAPGWERWSWSVRCSAQPVEFTSTLFEGVVPGHIHLVSAGGEQWALTGGVTRVRAQETGAGGWFVLGAEHVVTGLDHLVFLVLLLLVCDTRRRVLLAISSFTVGHALSLVGASLGVVTVDAPGAEMLIGASVVVLALEAGAGDGSRRAIVWTTVVAGFAAAALAFLGRPAAGVAIAGMTVVGVCAVLDRSRGWQWMGLVALFGLVHGLGFAEALRALGSDAVEPVPLALFNLGVEASQVALALVLWPLLQWGRRAQWTRRYLEPVLIGGAVALGVFWTASRLVEWAA